MAHPFPNLIFAAPLALLLVGQVQAAEEETARLPEVVIQGGTAPGVQAESVTNLDRSVLDQGQIRSLSDLRSRTPNLGVSSSSLRSFTDIYTVRGLGNTTFFSAPAVVQYVDDVPYGDVFAFSSKLNDISSVDIFRGPQGDAFGLNSEAGVIEMHTLPPGNDWHAAGSASWGSFQTQEYRLSLSGPLIKDRLAIGLAGYSELSEGFIHNTFVKRRTDDRDALGGRLTLHWTPAPDWDITLGIEGERFHDGSYRLVKLDGPAYSVGSDVPGNTDIERNGEFLRVVKRFDWATVTSVTTRREWKVDPSVFDLDLSDDPANAIASFRRSQDAWTQELRFDSPEPDLRSFTDKDGKTPRTELAGPWKWRTGLFYQDKSLDGDDRKSFNIPLPFVAGLTPYADRTLYRLEERNYAFYGRLTYSATERLDITAGARVDYTEKEMTKTRDRSFTAQLKGSGSMSELTVAPNLALDYRVNDHLGLFVRGSMGFKPGGFSPYVDDPALASYSRETVWTGEAGARINAFDNRLQAKVTGYYSRINDYQVERAFALADYLVLNADEAISRGVELELNAQLAEGLTLNAGLGYNETELQNFHDPGTGADLSGNEAPFVPNFTANVALDYAHRCGFRARVEYLVVGDTYYTDLNTPRYRQSAYGLLNLRLGYERDHWGIFLFGRNLTDTAYYTKMTTDIDAGSRGEPRVIGVMATLKY